MHLFIGACKIFDRSRPSLSDRLRPAFWPADFFWKNIFADLEPPRKFFFRGGGVGFIRAKVWVNVGVALGLCRAGVQDTKGLKEVRAVIFFFTPIMEQDQHGRSFPIHIDVLYRNGHL